MQTVSSRWAPALTTAHAIVTRVTATYDGAVTADNIPISGGSVHVDRSSDTRRSLSLEIPDPTNFPLSPTDPLGVYGQRLVVQSGLRYLDGSEEIVPLGAFVITDISGDPHLGPLSISGAGLEKIMIDAPVEHAMTTVGTGSVAGYISGRIEALVPGAGFTDLSTHGADPVATKTWDATVSEWQPCKDLAASIGAEIYCDAAGTFILRDVPLVSDVPTEAAWDVTAGQYGVMIGATVGLTSDDVYNRVVVTGENSEDGVPPIQGTVQIDDPLDPLRYGGPFGRRTYALSSSLATTSGQARIMATAELEKRRAPNKTVSISCVPNAALDAGDWIRVVYGSRASLPPELHLTQSFEVPLTADGASAFEIATVAGKADDQ